MNDKISLRLSFLGTTAFFIITLLFTATSTNAQTVTFAQFFQTNASNDFVFTNNGTNGTFTATSPVIFRYSNIAGLPPELQGDQMATVTVSAVTTTPVLVTAGRLIQPFNQTFTIRITRNAPATVGSGSRTNLLSAVVTPATSNSDISGDLNGNAAAYTATTPNQNILFSSDFITFPALGSRNFALSFSSVNPVLSIGPGGFANSFTAAGTGTFAANPGPTNQFPPTSAAVSVSGRVLGKNGRGLANAQVKLTNSEGEVFYALTNPFGYYRFYGIPVGETIVVTVTGKRNSYEPKALNVGEEIAGLDFVPVSYKSVK